MNQLKKTRFLSALSIVFVLSLVFVTNGLTANAATANSRTVRSKGTDNAAAAAKTARLNAIVQRMLNNQSITPQEKREAYPLFLRAEWERNSHQPPAVMNNGGPDGGGYYWIDNVTEPNGPTYSWIDISSTGTQVSVTSTDDGSCVLTNIGFSFPFYGTTYTQFTMATNGWISFSGTYAGLGSGYYSNTSLPNSGQPHPAIFPFWDDLYSTNMRYQVVNSQLVLEWVGSTSFSGASGTFTFEAILDPSGTIKVQYNTLGSQVNSSTIGLQDASGTNYTQVNLNGVPAGTEPTVGYALFFYQLGQAGTPAPANNATNTPTNATLNWGAAAAATGYDVYFNTFTPPTTLVSSNQAGITYNPGALSASTQYYWQIVSRNAGGTNAGPVWNFTTGVGAAPNAPSGGFTSGATTSSLTINWTDNSSNETGFPITNSIDGINYNPVTTAAANATSYNNTGLNSNTQYWYNVYSQNGGGTSVGFANANGWTLALTPGMPTLSSNGITAATIALVDGGNNANTQFAIYETGTAMYVQADGSLGASALWQTASQWGATTNIHGLLANTAYHVQAKARNGASVETSMSGTLNFTTAGAYSLPLTQDFSGATFPPADWSIINPDGLDTWALISGTPSWASIDFWDYTNYPQDDYLVTPPITTVGVTSAEVDFNWSYYGAFTATYDDGLEVKYSTDGGTTWISFWSRYAQSNPSLPAGTGAGTTNPASSDFGVGAAAVPAGALGQSSVEFAWMGHNAYGPNIYITNINIHSVSGPIIAVAPTSVAFGSVTVGNLVSQQIEVYNTGTTTLHVSNISATSVTPSTSSLTIAAGDSASFTISWTATSGSMSDNVVLTSDAGNNPSLSIPVTGFGLTIHSVPYSQDFNSGFPPTDWSIGHTGTGGWLWAGASGGAWGSDGSAYMDDYDQPNGNVDYLYTPVFNTTSASGMHLYFNWSYVELYANDELNVEYTTDGGTTWNSLWDYNGTGLNAGSGSDGWTTPANTGTWGLADIALPAGAVGHPAVQFAFVATSAYGTSMWVDNVAIGVPNIAANPTTINFGYVAVGNNSTLPTFIHNTGNVPLTVMSVTVPAEFSPSWTGNFIQPGDSAELDVMWTPGAEETLSGAYAVLASNGMSAPSDTIWFAGTSAQPAGVPSITVSYDLVNHNANLSWAQPSGTVDGYKVYRETTTGLFNPTPVRLVSTISGAANTTYQDAGATGHEYYVVTAYNAASSSVVGRGSTAGIRTTLPGVDKHSYEHLVNNGTRITIIRRGEDKVAPKHLVKPASHVRSNHVGQ